MTDEKNITPTVEQPTTASAENKVFTQEEVERLVQSEADRRVNLAQQKWQKETTKKLTQAEKLAQMSQEDQYKFKLEQKEHELEQKEREFTLRDNKIAAMKVLSDREIPADLVDFIVNEDADVMKANIDLLDKYIKQAVSAQVTKRMASPTPKAGLGINTEMTKESFAKMSITQRNELFATNRELYNKLKD